ncbi:MAG: hypothetical protein FD133_869 [Erysipelotrichaceae bacterium]|nr:MAG: hypothetical protein FD133_869 [Erysipelotrichaceae bacterium]
MKIKRNVIIGLFILSIFCLVYYLVSVAFFNMDYLGQGHPNSVTVHDSACITSICDEENWEITITSPEQLKDLESAFFNKTQDIFHFTKEDGPMSFVFHYDKKDIEFHASINIEFKGGTIYYTDRQIVYYFNKSDMSIFKEIFTFNPR